MNRYEIIQIQRDLAELLAEENHKLTQCDIAEILGVSQAAVSRWLIHAGLERSKGCRQKDQVRILRKANEDLSQAYIADLVGVSQTAVCKWLRETPNECIEW